MFVHLVGRGQNVSKRPTMPRVSLTTAKMSIELQKVQSPALNDTSGPCAAESGTL